MTTFERDSNIIVYRYKKDKRFAVIDRLRRGNCKPWEDAKVYPSNNIFNATKFKLETTVPSFVLEKHELEAVPVNFKSVMTVNE